MAPVFLEDALPVGTWVRLKSQRKPCRGTSHVLQHQDNLVQITELQVWNAPKESEHLFEVFLYKVRNTLTDCQSVGYASKLKEGCQIWVGPWEIEPNRKE